MGQRAYPRGLPRSGHTAVGSGDHPHGEELVEEELVAHLESEDRTRHELEGPMVRIGRDAGNDIVLAGDRRASRQHAELRLADGQWYLADLESRNGSMVNGRRVTERPLVDGDQLVFGGSRFAFVAGPDPHATETASIAVGGLPEAPFSPREREVIGLVANGLTDREIAAQLFISPSTVRSHLDRIADKTGLRRRSELTRLAVELRLVD